MVPKELRLISIEIIIYEYHVVGNVEIVFILEMDAPLYGGSKNLNICAIALFGLQGRKRGFRLMVQLL